MPALAGDTFAALLPFTFAALLPFPLRVVAFDIAAFVSRFAAFASLASRNRRADALDLREIARHLRHHARSMGLALPLTRLAVYLKVFSSVMRCPA